MKCESKHIRIAMVVLIALGLIGTAQSFAAVQDQGEKSKQSKTKIYFDKRSYNFGQKATVFLFDKNLNKHHDAIDFYRPQSGFISLEIGGKRVSDVFMKKVFQSSFFETGPNTGFFKAKLKIPIADEVGKSTKGKDIKITYIDINNRVTWHDRVTVR